ncbi:hypothetical protein GPALN_012155 [Globodera pallida]|nr:hypothetical protein GPALN_012155 [Globodera pallida]
MSLRLLLAPIIGEVARLIDHDGLGPTGSEQLLCKELARFGGPKPIHRGGIDEMTIKDAENEAPPTAVVGFDIAVHCPLSLFPHFAIGASNRRFGNASSQYWVYILLFLFLHRDFLA